MLPWQGLEWHGSDLDALHGLLRQLLGIHLLILGQRHAVPPPNHVHAVLAVLVPLSHVAEHDPNSDQGLHLPFTDIKMRRYLIALDGFGSTITHKIEYLM